MLIVFSAVAWKVFLRCLLYYFQDYEGNFLAINLFYFENLSLACASYGTFLCLAYHSDIFLLNLGISQRILCTLSSHFRAFIFHLRAA